MIILSWSNHMSTVKICEYCNKEFTPCVGAKGRYCSKPCQHSGMAIINRERAAALKALKPVSLCKECNNPILTTHAKLFCSSSCSATYHNSRRGPKTLETKIKISISMRGKIPHNKGKIGNTGTKQKVCITKIGNTITKQKVCITKNSRQSFRQSVVGPYTRVYGNICYKTGLIFYSRSYQKYHPSIIVDKQHYAIACKFRFSISQFPQWFDGNLIKQHGWYSTPGSRKGIKNLNGVSRDHRISVDYGYRNNIDPAIINHPANCQLVLHNDNQRKYNKCSIDIKQLLEDIKRFNSLYPNWQVAQVPPPAL